MDFGKEGLRLVEPTARRVVLTIKEKVRLSSKAIAVIWARILDLVALRTLGLSRILRSSFKVLFERSASGPWGLRPGGMRSVSF